MADDGRPIRVAIIGGGCAAVSTAFELTRPEHQGRYEVTVYQLGWRLGGKGASGRGPADRIEEHGLHVWMGWYENAFRLMRECYEELNRDPRGYPIASWRDVFIPTSLVGVTDRTPDGHWRSWNRIFPPAPGLPGDPPTEAQRWSVAMYLMRTVSLLRSLFEGVQLRVDRTPSSRPPGSAGTSESGEARATADSHSRTGKTPEAIAEVLSDLVRYGELATLAGLTHGIGLLEVLMGSLTKTLFPSADTGATTGDAAGAAQRNLLLRFLDAVAINARRLLEARLEADLELRRIWQVIDLTLATLRGQLRSGLMTDPRGFDAIDEFDCREWLLLNGASRSSVESGYMNGLYDLGFGYEDGDREKPAVSAAQALRGFLRAFFTYRGAFFWKLRGGMGDVVFAPFYEVLRRRGVRFEFFHRLTNVRLADAASLAEGETPYVEALEFDVQASTITPGAPYEPLGLVKGMPCWPARPDYRQLAEGERLEREGWDFESHWDRRRVDTRTLRVVEHFDFAVLGVGLGAVPHVCREIVGRDHRWRAMVQNVKTVPTQAFQIWLQPDMAGLGWSGPPITLSGFVEPFDTWADMRHLLPCESWTTEPGALAYFCGVLPVAKEPLDELDPSFPTRQLAVVRENAVRFLKKDIRHLWPAAVDPTGEFRWDLLAVPHENGSGAVAGEGRFASQFWVANVNPSDRYTLALPGSSRYRISPLDRAYDNFVIVGDWTNCGFNSGCVEAAVMSGRLGAHAISKSPALEDIVGFDHP
jgi:uncharacterized protein with NAD-binding domain and iron-sulfur cluster